MPPFEWTPYFDLIPAGADDALLSFDSQHDDDRHRRATTVRLPGLRQCQRVQVVLSPAQVHSDGVWLQLSVLLDHGSVDVATLCLQLELADTPAGKSRHPTLEQVTATLRAALANRATPALARFYRHAPDSAAPQASPQAADQGSAYPTQAGPPGSSGSAAPLPASFKRRVWQVAVLLPVLALGGMWLLNQRAGAGPLGTTSNNDLERLLLQPPAVSSLAQPNADANLTLEAMKAMGLDPARHTQSLGCLTQ